MRAGRCFFAVVLVIVLIKVEDCFGCKIIPDFEPLKPYFNKIYTLSSNPITEEHDAVLRAMGNEDPAERHQKHIANPVYALETDGNCNVYWVRKGPEPQEAVKLTTKEVSDRTNRMTRRFTVKGNVLTEERTMTTPQGKRSATVRAEFNDKDMTITTKVGRATYVEEYTYSLRKSTGYKKHGNKNARDDFCNKW